MSGDVFNDVTDVYEAMIDWPKRLANEGRFFRRLFDDVGVSRVVDVACGTGRHGAMFHSWGMEVEGADIGTSMIERARTNLGEPANMRLGGSWIRSANRSERTVRRGHLYRELARARPGRRDSPASRARDACRCAERRCGGLACAQPLAFSRRPVPVAEMQTRHLGARGRLDCQRCPPCWNTRLCGPYRCVTGGVE